MKNNKIHTFKSQITSSLKSSILFTKLTKSVFPFLSPHSQRKKTNPEKLEETEASFNNLT
jgi:hypothetical protein